MHANALGLSLSERSVFCLLYRTAVLLCAGLLSFGCYFAYDSVGAMVSALIAGMHTDRESIALLYSCYSLAAMVSVVAGGALVDRLGTRAASLLFSGLVCAGALLVALAPSLPVMYLGRVVFGCGAESLVVAQNAILARWFTGRRLALAFGVLLSMAKLGTLFSFNAESLLAERLGFRGALLIAAALCGLSLLGSLVYVTLDRRASRSLDLPPEGVGTSWSFPRVAHFPRRFWLLTLLCATFYSAYIPFVSLSADFFHQKWGLPQSNPSQAGLFGAVWHNLRHLFSTAPGTSSIITLSSLVLAPLAGVLGSRVRRRTTLMALASALTVPAFLCLGFSSLPPSVPMFVLGLAFVLLPTALWPMIPLLVQRDRIGSAMGLMAMLQNAGLALFPWVNGRLRDLTQDYSTSMVMFAAMGGVGVLLALHLRRDEPELEAAATA